jgi:signal transduction histidine kinase
MHHGGNLRAMDERAESAGIDASGLCLDVFPEPVARYVVSDERIVLTAANNVFAASFVADRLGTSLQTWFEENGIDVCERPAEEIRRLISDGESVDVSISTGSTDQTTHRLRSAADAGTANTGTLTVVSDSETSDSIAAGEQIARVVSHDLRNPLDVAKARAQAARETGAAEHFDRLDQAHDRMERIINDVLTLARDDGIVDPSPAVDLDAVAADAWATVETGSATLERAGDLPTVEADPDRLQRLLENLLRNSIEHGTVDANAPSRTDTTPERARPTQSSDRTGGDSVTVRIGTTTDGFFIADDGPGIPPIDRNRVFDPGYADADGGTGLGLTIVKQIATAHGWTVTVRKSDSGGARFEFKAADPTTSDTET